MSSIKWSLQFIKWGLQFLNFNFNIKRWSGIKLLFGLQIQWDISPQLNLCPSSDLLLYPLKNPLSYLFQPKNSNSIITMKMNLYFKTFHFHLHLLYVLTHQLTNHNTNIIYCCTIINRNKFFDVAFLFLSFIF